MRMIGANIIVPFSMGNWYDARLTLVGMQARQKCDQFFDIPFDRKKWIFVGTLEFAWLNILIKNGLLGVVGYIIIFIRSYNVMFFKTNDWSLRTPCFAITTICMLSSIAVFTTDYYSIFYR